MAFQRSMASTAGPRPMFVFGASSGSYEDSPTGQQGSEAAPRMEPRLTFRFEPVAPVAQPLFGFGEPLGAQPAAPMFRFDTTNPAPAPEPSTGPPETRPSQAGLEEPLEGSAAPMFRFGSRHATDSTPASELLEGPAAPMFKFASHHAADSTTASEPFTPPQGDPTFQAGLETPREGPAAPSFGLGGHHAASSTPASELFTPPPENLPSQAGPDQPLGCSTASMFRFGDHHGANATPAPVIPATRPFHAGFNERPEGMFVFGSQHAASPTPASESSTAQVGGKPRASRSLLYGSRRSAPKPPATADLPGAPEAAEPEAQAWAGFSTVFGALPEALGQACDPQHLAAPAETAAAHAWAGEQPADSSPAGVAVEEQMAAAGEQPAPEAAVAVEAKHKEAFAVADALKEEGRYAEAAAKCLEVLSGPEAVLGLLDEILGEWEDARDSQERHAREQDAENRDLSAQLASAKEVAASLRERTKVEARRREAAEAEGQNLRTKMADHYRLRAESQRLEHRTWELEAELRGAEERASRPGRQVVLRRVADLECDPLKHCGPQERAALRKKLLMKWHPDKQPSPDNAALATVVMQELQNHRDWNNDA